MRKRAVHSYMCKTMIFVLILSFFACNNLCQTYAEEEYFQFSQQAQPNRIVVFPLYAEEILLDMIGPERIVYVGHEYWEEGSSYSPTMPLTKSIPGSAWQNSDENALVRLQPDLLILEGDLESAYSSGSLFPLLREADIPVLFVSQPNSIQDIKSLILSLGEAANALEEADTMVLRMESELKKIDTMIQTVSANDSLKGIYYNNWQREFSFLAEYCCLTNMFEPTEDYVQLNDDCIAAWNPDIIFFNPVWKDTDGSILKIDQQYIEDMRRNILHNPALSNTAAITEDRVYPISLHSSHYVVQSMMELICRAYPHLLNNHETLGSGITLPAHLEEFPLPEDKLLGTWILYAGGTVAPEVLQFDSDGMGVAYHLPKDYDEEPWLNGKGVDASILTNADSFFWVLELEDENHGTLQIKFFSQLAPECYEIFFEDDLDGTSLPGFSLLQGIGGGGWVQATLYH